MRFTKTYLFFAAILLCWGFVACEGKEETTSEENASFHEKNAQKFSQKLEIPKNRNVELLPEAKTATTNWMAYLTTKNEIERLENFTFQEVVDNSNNMLRSITEMQDSIPEKFQETPIKAQLNVLLTKAHLLSQEAKRQQPTAENIQELSKDLYIAFGNLEIQLNEVFHKPLEDFEFELDERNKRQDSLAKLKPDSIPNLQLKKKK